MLPLLGVLAPVIGTLIDRLVPDKAEAARTKAELETKLLEASQQANLAQIEVNKIEAGHRTVFVAGWRPAVGWTCAFALLYQAVLYDLLSWALVMAGVTARLPSPNSEILLAILPALLGIGALRTFEKTRGVAG